MVFSQNIVFISLINLILSLHLFPLSLSFSLREIMAMRGKRGMNFAATIAELRALEPKAADTATLLRIQSLVPLLQFDHVAQRDSLMSQRGWLEAVRCVGRILQTLKENPTVRLAEDDSHDAFSFDTADNASDIDVDDYVENGEDEAWAARRQRAEEEAAKRRARAEEEMRREQQLANGGDEDTTKYTFVEGNLYAYVFKISNEFYRALQNTDYASPEYVNRLREQPTLVKLFAAVRDYYRSINKARLEARVAHLWIEYEYYYYRTELDVLSPAVAATPAAAAPSATLVDELANTLYKSDDMRARVRALLFQTYSWLIHNRYEEARARLLSAHVQVRAFIFNCIFVCFICLFTVFQFHSVHMALFLFELTFSLSQLSRRSTWTIVPVPCFLLCRM